MAAETPTEAAELLSPDQGDTMVRPRPEPSRRRMSVTPSAATAPPMIGPQDMADAEDSTGLADEPVIDSDMCCYLTLPRWRGG